MGRFRNSWNFFKCSLPVIVKNKKLLLFPMIELFFIVIIGIFFISPIFLWDSGHSITEFSHWEALGEHYGNLGEQYGNMLENQEKEPGTIIKMIFTKTVLAWCALYYLISIFSVTFINVAFYNEIINGLNGKRVSLLGGIKAAFSKIKLIIIWFNKHHPVGFSPNR